MASRKPLVIVAGQIEQLQAGDSIVGASGSGSSYPFQDTVGTAFDVLLSVIPFYNTVLAFMPLPLNSFKQLPFKDTSGTVWGIDLS